MRKSIFILIAVVMAVMVSAQEKVTRTMRVFYDGNVVYDRNVAMIDSIKFLRNEESGGGSGDADGSGDIYVGVVAFNKNVNQISLTNDLGAAKLFITTQTNDLDFTAFAYSVSKGNMMFDAAGLPAFDKIFMLNFSDGTDNYSNRKWGDEGRIVGQKFVYDTARYDLLERVGLNSYAIGFGNDVGFGPEMRKVVMGSGSYYNAVSSAQLQPTFNEIANSIIASSKNVVLKTNSGYYFEDNYKYFRFTFMSESNIADTILAKMSGNPNDGFTLDVVQPGTYAQFVSPAHGTEDEATGKVLIPLNNLKFISEEEELQFEFDVEVSFDGILYYRDVEEASTAESISKRIAVVLVLDCSTSMGDAFEPMQSAAIDFIETLENMSSADDPSHGDSVFADYTETLGSVSFGMVAVKGGTFVMGAQTAGAALPNYDTEAESDESPVHNVALSDFFIGETEITQGVWEYVMGAHNVTHYPDGAEQVYLYPAFNASGNLVGTGGQYCYGGSVPSASYGDGDDYPVYYVSYNDIVGKHGFLDRLNALTGKHYRLPTEAEWEYAARGGQKNRYTNETTDAAGEPSSSVMYKYSGGNLIGDVAWYNNNASGKSHPVKTKQANELGIYDMSGNVCEWCSDWYGNYNVNDTNNPVGPSSGSYRVFRGGGWYDGASGCRVSFRNYGSPGARDGDLGFRVVVIP